MKNKFRVKNGKCGAIANAFLLVACLAAVQGSVKKERGEGENRADVSADLWRERKVVRARKVLNYALFEAIHRGNFRGVQFLIERGANPQVENKKGQKPLDLAEILAEEFPEEAERLEIVGLLSDDAFGQGEDHPNQLEIDDRTIVETAQKISGLMGGGEVETKYEQYRVAQRRFEEARTNYEKSKLDCSTVKNQLPAADRRFREAKDNYEAVKNRQEAAQREVERASREIKELKIQTRTCCDRRNALSQKIIDKWNVFMQCGNGIYRLESLPEYRLKLTRKEIEEKKKAIEEKKETIMTHGGYGPRGCNCGLIGKVRAEEKELEEKKRELEELGNAIKEYEAIKAEHEKSMKQLKLAEERLKTVTAEVEKENKKSKEALEKQREEWNRVEKIKNEIKKASDREREECEKVNRSKMGKDKAEQEYNAAKKKAEEEAEAKRKAEAEAAAKKKAEEKAAKKRAKAEKKAKKETEAKKQGNGKPVTVYTNVAPKPPPPPVPPENKKPTTVYTNVAPKPPPPPMPPESKKPTTVPTNVEAKQKAEAAAKKKAEEEKKAAEAEEKKKKEESFSASSTIGIALTTTSAIAKPLQFFPPAAIPARIIGRIADAGRKVLAAINVATAAMNITKKLKDNASKENEKPAEVQNTSAAPSNPPIDPDDKNKNKDKGPEKDPKTVKSKKIVHFGQNSNQTRHTFRHTDEYGLPRREVQSAIEQDLAKNMQKIDLQKSYTGTVTANGTKLEYNVYEIADGEINVGKIIIKKKQK